MHSLRRSWWRVPQSQNTLPVCKAELCGAWLAALTLAEQVCHPPVLSPLPRLGVQELWAGFCQALAQHCKLDVLSPLAALTLLAPWGYPRLGIPLLFAKPSTEKMVKKQATGLDPRNPNLLWSSLLGTHILPYLWSERKVLKHQLCTSSWHVYPLWWKRIHFHRSSKPWQNSAQSYPSCCWAQNVGRIMAAAGTEHRGLQAHHYLRGSRGGEIWEEISSRTVENNADIALFKVLSDLLSNRSVFNVSLTIRVPVAAGVQTAPSGTGRKAE